jgi:hypothetical protein
MYQAHLEEVKVEGSPKVGEWIFSPLPSVHKMGCGYAVLGTILMLACLLSLFSALNPDKWIEFKLQDTARVSHNTHLFRYAFFFPVVDLTEFGLFWSTLCDISEKLIF